MAAFVRLTEVYYVKYSAPENPNDKYADRDRYRYDQRTVWVNLAHVVDMRIEPAVPPRTSTPDGKPEVTSLRANDGHWDVIEKPDDILRAICPATASSSTDSGDASK